MEQGLQVWDIPRAEEVRFLPPLPRAAAAAPLKETVELILQSLPPPPPFWIFERKDPAVLQVAVLT